MSLFNTYPAEDPRAQRETCCDALDPAPDGVDAQCWAFCHVIAHGRVPITPAALAQLAGVDPPVARKAIDAAVGAGWMAFVEAEGYMRRRLDLWVGTLTKARR